MQIKKVAQGCRLGNQAEFIPIPLINTNHQKKLHRREHFQVHHCTHRSVYSTSTATIGLYRENAIAVRIIDRSAYDATSRVHAHRQRKNLSYLRNGCCIHRGIRHRVLTNQRDRSYVYAVVSLAAGGPFVGGPIVTYIFSRVSVGSACVRVWKRDCGVTSLVEHRVKSLQQNGP